MVDLLPRWLLLRRSTRRRAARVARLIVCAFLVFGLTPGSEDVVGTLVHLLHDGHLPHSAAHREVAATEDCDTDCEEHGCTPLAHHCKCCPSGPALPVRTPSPERFVHHVGVERFRSASERGPPRDGVKPTLRPPIA